MKALEFETENNFKIPHEVIGRIVNNIDPEDRGRLQCFIIGITEDNTNDQDLPWCETKGVLIAGNNSTIGLSSVPDIGTHVYISFLYNNPSFPIVTGYVRGNKDSSLLHTVKNLSSTISQTRTDNKIGPELDPLNSSSEYPKNNVIETETAVIEIDDTSTNQRISIQHKNGSYFEIRPNGDIQIKTINNEYNIIKGNLEEYIEGAVNKVLKSTYNEDTAGGRTISTTTTTHIGDLMVTGDIICSGIVKASDCISDTISGKSHQHNDPQGGTVSTPI